MGGRGRLMLGGVGSPLIVWAHLAQGVAAQSLLKRKIDNFYLVHLFISLLLLVLGLVSLMI